MNKKQAVKWVIFMKTDGAEVEQWHYNNTGISKILICLQDTVRLNAYYVEECRIRNLQETCMWDKVCTMTC